MNKLRKWYRTRTAEKVVFTVAGVVAIALLSGWGIWSYVDSQKAYPLGDKLEYVGRSEYGCPFICDAAPGTTYYYATDMTAEEVVKYFGKAKRDPSLDGPGGYVSSSIPYTFDSLGFRTPNGIFIINIYSDSKLAIRDYGLINTTKATILSLDKKFFLKAQQAL